MGILNACLRPSAQKAFHLFDQCLGSLAPGCAIQAEFFGFVVVSVLHSERGEGTGNNRREMSCVDGGVLPRWCNQAIKDFSRHCCAAQPQLASSTSGSSRRWAILRSRPEAMRSSRSASGLAIEQNALS